MLVEAMGAEITRLQKQLMDVEAREERVEREEISSVQNAS